MDFPFRDRLCYKSMSLLESVTPKIGVSDSVGPLYLNNCTRVRGGSLLPGVFLMDPLTGLYFVGVDMEILH